MCHGTQTENLTMSLGLLRKNERYFRHLHCKGRERICDLDVNQGRESSEVYVPKVSSWIV